MARSSPLYLLLVFYSISVKVGCNYADTASYSGSPGISTSPDALRTLVQEFEGFKKQLATIESRLKTLQTTLEQKLTTSDDSKCTIRDIAEAIRSHKFQQAELKFNELTDKTKMANIIHEVYADSPVNVDVILGFTKAMKSSESQYLVYSALRDEMRSTGNSDPFKLIAVVETMEREMTKVKNDEIKAKFKGVIDNTVEDVKVTATSMFKTAMINDKYSKNVEIESLANALFDFRTDVSNEVMERVVDGVFGVVAAGKILENISSHKSIPQIITGLTAVFNRFNFAGNLNNDATISLASHLRQVQQRDNYASLGQDLKNDVDKVVEQLPTCARNLFFHTYVCLWNKASGQFLYAASSSISHDNERRSIFTWYPGDTKEGAFWDVQLMGNDFFFKNRDYVDEYMYAAAIDFNKDLRYVFNWIPGNNTDPQSAWKIELDGDYCYVKTTYFNEYLFASSMKFDQLNNHVFTWKPGTSVKGAEFLWQVRNCGQGRAAVGTTH